APHRSWKATCFFVLYVEPTRCVLRRATASLKCECPFLRSRTYPGSVGVRHRAERVWLGARCFCQLRCCRTPAEGRPFAEKSRARSAESGQRREGPIAPASLVAPFLVQVIEQQLLNVV